MKQLIISLIVVAVIFASCEEGSLYSYNRPYFSKSFKTQDERELKTAALKDTILIENGQPVISAYFAVIKGEFTHVLDTIVQYGHCWSTNNKNPVINPEDTSTFSSYNNWEYDSLGTFTSYISLFPETPFYVRSYVITSKGDTGYNQQIYVDTTIPPINEWFIATDFGNGNDGREGAVSMTLTYNGSTKAYIVGGNNASQVLGDLWEYDPETDTWIQMPGSLEPPRTEAVGFAIVKEDCYGRKQRKLYVGTGKDASGDIYYSDFWEYSFTDFSWHVVQDSFPIGIASGVAFSIDDKGYVGTGITKNNIDIGQLFMFDYKRIEQNRNPWVLMEDLGNDPLLNARHDAVAFSIGGLGFIATGRQNNSGSNPTYFNDLWIFQPPNSNNPQGVWGQKSDFPSFARSEAIAFSVDKQGYVGLGADNETLFQDLYRYDPYSDQWFLIADFKDGPQYSGQLQKMKNGFAFGIDKKGYVGTGFYGEDADIRYSREFWIYRPW